MDFPNRRDVVLGIAASVTSIALANTAQAKPRVISLFFIERSKNDNVVHYDLPLGKNDKPRTEEPLDVYWRMHAERGQRQELSGLERSLAYGYSVESKPGAERLVISLHAFRERRIAIERLRTEFHAILAIESRKAVLERIFVKTDEEAILPRVLYVELDGRDLDTGRPLRERIRP